jgi:23S rRNA (uridine2552-2'-O)-methyltransferase
MYRKDVKEEFYTRKAREENYPARSVYKLKEINEKYKIIKPGDKVLDLGCAPGSWLLYISEKVGEKGMVVGVDLRSINIPEKKNIIFIKKDILELETQKLKIKYNAVVSDLAPNTSGIDFADVEESLELSEEALEIAKKVLVSGGNFVCKILEGEGINDFFKKIKSGFEFCKRFRPKATRRESREIYIVAKNFKYERI